MHVNYAEYSYFKQLPKIDQIQFLFELYDAATIKERGTLDLSEFFVSVQEYIHNSETEESEDKGNMEIVPVEDVKNCVEARDFLKSHGLKEYIYSKAQIKTEAERMGFSFPNL